jgi:lipopolysaccharide export system permease protein
MGILGRYIIREILKLLFPIWLGLGFMLFLLEWLAQVFNVNAPAATVLSLYFYKLPFHLQLCFPIAVLFSCLVVLGTMNRAREAVAVQSLGLRMRAMVLPAAIAVAIASFPFYWVINSLSPWGMRKHYEIYDREVLHVPSRFSQVRQEKIWYRNRDVLYNVGFFDHEKSELYDITLYTFDDDFHIAQTISAKSATWNGTNWILKDGHINLTDKRLEAPVSERFQSRSTRLMEAPKALARVELNADTMGQDELIKFIRRNHALGINTSRWEVVYQSRFSYLVIPFVFLILAFSRALRFRRAEGVARDAAFVAAVSLVYWLLFNLGINLGNVGKLPPVVAAWGPSMLFASAMALFWRTRNLQSESM